MRGLPAALLAALVALACAPAQACGAETPCQVIEGFETLGEYRVREPSAPGPKPQAGRPALVFIHGWRSNAAAIVSNKGLRAFADEIGAVLIAPEGLRMTWSYPGSPSDARDEFAYFDALRRDAIERLGVDPNRILVAGFSMGGSMAWNLACHRGDAYWGFVAFSGAFWTPMPNTCDRPASRLIHIHGETDKVVPIEGRPIRARFAQADAVKSMEVLLRSAQVEAKETSDLAGMRCERWDGSGRLVEFCRHAGGHFWTAPWLRAAYQAMTAR